MILVPNLAFYISSPNNTTLTGDELDSNSMLVMNLNLTLIQLTGDELELLIRAGGSINVTTNTDFSHVVRVHPSLSVPRWPFAL